MFAAAFRHFKVTLILFYKTAASALFAISCKPFIVSDRSRAALTLGFIPGFSGNTGTSSRSPLLWTLWWFGGQQQIQDQCDHNSDCLTLSLSLDGGGIPPPPLVSHSCSVFLFVPSPKYFVCFPAQFSLFQNPLTDMVYITRTRFFPVYTK